MSMKNKYECPSCWNEFEITYDDEEILDEIKYCPFCGSNLTYIEEVSDRTFEDGKEWEHEDSD